MEFKPGDILYRKYSDKNDLYLILAIIDGPFNVGPNVKFVRMLSYYSSSAQNPILTTESSDSIANWYVKIDLNKYDIKEKFLTKIQAYLELNLGKMIAHETILDNLLYIEILAILRQYENPEAKEEHK